MKKIKQKIKVYEDVGFAFYPAWTIDEPRTPDRVELPSGRILSKREIDEKLELLNLQKVKTREYRELRFANRFYDLIRELDSGERYDLYNTSFRDEEDIRFCKRKYIGANPLI